VAIALLLGATAGIGTYTFGYAGGASYLKNDPQVCANCHVMQGHLDAWVKSSHSKFATCNDCHAPHNNLANKLYCKARNGFFHSLAFTTGDFPENLRITDYNRKVTEAACRDCHAETVHQIDLRSVGELQTGKPQRVESNSCIRCHATVGHDT
jgi:cytochrome c nitrite reductase small subunit